MYTMDSIHIHNDLHFIDEFQQTLDKGGPFSPWNLFEMAYEAERTTIPTQFGGLLSLKYLPHMEFLPHQIQVAEQVIEEMHGRDRKSTRLNSSHVSISYAVCCLKKYKT